MSSYSLGSNVKLGSNVLLGQGVVIGDNVEIGDFTIIRDHCTIGANSFVGPHSIIGERTADYYESPAAYKAKPTYIAEGALIRSHAIIYADVTIGERFQCGHRVTIREQARIGHHVRIGTLSDIQGHCKIGNYVSMHSNVHIGHESVIKDYVWIFPYVVLTNDPHPPSAQLSGVTLESFAVIATGSILLPGITVGEDSLVGALSLVKMDVKPETVVVGNPAKEICSVRKIKNKFTGEPVYPWRYQFKKGMPWEDEGYDNWLADCQIDDEPLVPTGG